MSTIFELYPRKADGSLGGPPADEWDAMIGPRCVVCGRAWGTQQRYAVARDGQAYQVCSVPCIVLIAGEWATEREHALVFEEGTAATDEAAVLRAVRRSLDAPPVKAAFARWSVPVHTGNAP